MPVVPSGSATLIGPRSPALRACLINVVMLGLRLRLRF
jgi:hypothetical protein